MLGSRTVGELGEWGGVTLLLRSVGWGGNTTPKIGGVGWEHYS